MMRTRLKFLKNRMVEHQVETTECALYKSIYTVCVIVYTKIMYNLINKDRKREIILQGSGKKKTYMQANNLGKLPIVRLRYVHILKLYYFH
jgi:hypothetical protein